MTLRWSGSHGFRSQQNHVPSWVTSGKCIPLSERSVFSVKWEQEHLPQGGWEHSESEDVSVQFPLPEHNLILSWACLAFSTLLMTLTPIRSNYSEVIECQLCAKHLTDLLYSPYNNHAANHYFTILQET